MYQEVPRVGLERINLQAMVGGVTKVSKASTLAGRLTQDYSLLVSNSSLAGQRTNEIVSRSARTGRGHTKRITLDSLASFISCFLESSSKRLRLHFMKIHRDSSDIRS